MPNSNTFDVKPIGDFVRRYLAESKISVDPFSRDKRWATHTNDLDPTTKAESHEDAEKFVQRLAEEGTLADLVIFDPPYSPRQMSECYKKVGIEVGMRGTQNGPLYSRVRDAIALIVPSGGYVLSFGWNSSGMGKKQSRMLKISVCLIVRTAADQFGSAKTA